MNAVFTPRRPSQSRTAVAVNSGPLSERMCSGGPRRAKRSTSTARTSSEFSRRATGTARHSRVHSSITVSILIRHPSRVRSEDACTSRPSARAAPAWAGGPGTSGPRRAARHRLLTDGARWLAARCACGSPADPPPGAGPSRAGRRSARTGSPARRCPPSAPPRRPGPAAPSSGSTGERRPPSVRGRWRAA